MVRVIPLELSVQEYQDEMKSNVTKRVSISCSSFKMDDDNISIGGVSNRRWRSDTVVSVVVPDTSADDNGKKKRAFTPSIVEYVKVFSILYALIMTIVGLIFPISEALTGNWLRTTYNAVFMSYQLIVGTTFLIYLQIFGIIQKRKTKQRKKKESSNEECEGPSGMGNRTASFGNLSLASSIIDENTNDGGNAIRRKGSQFTRSAKDDSPGSGTSTPVGGSSMLPGLQRRASIYADFDQRRPSVYTDIDAPGSFENDGSSSTLVWMDISKFGSIFNHEGSSLFLKFGALMFCIGNIIYYALEIEYSMTHDVNCQLTYIVGWTFILRLIFVLVQTFFIFKGTEVNQKKHLPFLWFGMLHLVSTNICLWFRIVVREIMEEMKDMSHEDSNYNTTSISHDNNNNNNNNNDNINNSYPCDSALMHVASRFLFPFVLEYSLIAVGTIACIVHSISQPTDSEGNLFKGLKNLIKVCSLQQATGSGDDGERNAENGGDEAREHRPILRKSHSGMFLGSLLFAGVIVTIVMFYFFDERTDLAYFVADIILHCCLLVACLVALVLIRPLAYVAKPVTTDDAFLVIAMCGSAMYEITIIVASAATIEEPNGDPNEPLRLSASVIAVFETLVQAMLILCAVRRYPSSKDQVEEMPGRGTFTFLIVGNVSVWVLRTPLAKSVEMSTMIRFYGEVTWLLLANFNLPLLLFFRFHCSVCFADIWQAAYKPLGSKLKKLKRSPTAIPVTSEETPAPAENKLQVPQICIIGPSSENEENAADSISLASYNSTTI